MVRKHSHDEAEGIHSSRREQVYGSTSKPVKKPRRTGPVAFPKQPHDASVNSIKKRIRDITRRLERVKDLPADIRVENERALAAYQQKLVAAEEESVRQKMIKKYHMVRFFERKKATKQVKKLRKRLLEVQTTAEVEEIKVLLHIAEVDLNYALYCPLNEIYVGLYGTTVSSRDEKEEGNTPQRAKPAMWGEVEKRMESGGLDELRNGTRSKFIPRLRIHKLNTISSIRAPAHTVTNKESLSSKKELFNTAESWKAPKARQKQVGKAADTTDDTKVSDGGFFEE